MSGAKSAGFAASQTPVDDAGAASVPAEQEESGSGVNLQGSIKITVISSWLVMAPLARGVVG